MKVIQDEQDFNAIEKCIDAIIDKSKEFPDKVFKSGFNYYLFTEFYFILQETLYDLLKEYMNKIGEETFWVSAVSPDPRKYFRFHYVFYAAIEFSISDDTSAILSALNDYPNENLADSIAVNTNSILVSSYSNQWAVYGERDQEIAVCGFVDKSHMEMFREVFRDVLLGDERKAAEFTHYYNNTFDVERFCKNYRTD
jgi:hypothetical protein